MCEGSSYFKRAHILGVSPDEMKLSPINAIASSSSRSKDWEDVVTAHAGETSARTWRVQDKKIGAWTFDMDEGEVQVSCRFIPKDDS